MALNEARHGASTPQYASSAQYRPAVDDEARMLRFFGPNPEPYLRKWYAMYARDPSLSTTLVGWNWPAFLFLLPWALYRKMWLHAAIFVALPIAAELALLAATGSSHMMGASSVSWLSGAVMGLFSKAWYVQSAARKIRKLQAQGRSEQELLAEIDRIGGVSTVGLLVGIVVLASAMIATAKMTMMI